jgi:hypothetical protein
MNDLKNPSKPFDDSPMSWIFGIARSRFGTGGAGGFVTLPITNGNKALTNEEM